jgi:hypothetical protein
MAGLLSIAVETHAANSEVDWGYIHLPSGGESRVLMPAITELRQFSELSRMQAWLPIAVCKWELFVVQHRLEFAMSYCHAAVWPGRRIWARNSHLGQIPVLASPWGRDGSHFTTFILKSLEHDIPFIFPYTLRKDSAAWYGSPCGYWHQPTHLQAMG